MVRWSRNLADHSRTRAPSQSGRNLGDRYLILEKSLGGKEALKKCRNSHRQQHGTDTINVPTLSPQFSVFRGFIVPMEPPPPESDACCMSGCAVCVYDLYGESLEAYKNAVADLRVKLTMVNIPEDQWPKNIQTSSPNTQVVNPASAVQSAFEEMERVLKDKRESEVHTAV